MTDRREFAQVCYAAARRLHGRVEEITPPGATPNFHLAVIVRRERRIALLAHQHLPLLAVAVPIADGEMEFSFIDDPEVAAVLASLTTFRLLSVEELGTPLTDVDLSSLDDAELAQIAYWKPYSVGELLFNYWD